MYQGKGGIAERRATVEAGDKACTGHLRHVKASSHELNKGIAMGGGT